MRPKSSIDISPEDLQLVKSILKKYVPTYVVWAFGSRTRATARQYSDLDLVILTNKPLDFNLYATIKDAFSESNLPFKVDIVDWANINDNFKKIIKQHYIVIQEPIVNRL